MQRNISNPHGSEKEKASDPEYSQTCINCSTKPGNILICACDHNLCLNCAAKQFENDSQKNPLSKNVIMRQKLWCKLCKSPTDLEPDAVSELQSILKNKSKSKITKFSELRPKQFPKTSINMEMQNSKSGFCKDHPGEFRTYFCFDCVDNLICSECVIHGIHHNHNVLTTKKAIPRIKTKLEEIRIALDSSLSKVKENFKELDVYKKKIADDSQISKQKVREIFDSIKELLNSKQSDLLLGIDFQFDQNLKYHDSMLQNLNKKFDELKRNYEVISQTISSSDVVILFQENIVSIYSNRNEIQSTITTYEDEQYSYIASETQTLKKSVISTFENILLPKLNVIQNAIKNFDTSDLKFDHVPTKESPKKKKQIVKEPFTKSGYTNNTQSEQSDYQDNDDDYKISKRHKEDYLNDYPEINSSYNKK